MLLAIAFLVNESLIATQIVISIFLSNMVAAFIMHITLSVATRSAAWTLYVSISRVASKSALTLLNLAHLNHKLGEAPNHAASQKVLT